MDAPTKPRRRWTEKRWWAAGMLWAAGAYLLSLWPAGYAVGRGWVSGPTAESLYRPVEAVTHAMLPQPIHRAERQADGTFATFAMPDPDPPPRALSVIARGYLDVAGWCYEIGERHAEEAANR